MPDGGNFLWSERVQGIMTLFLSRRLRFDDCFRDQYKMPFHLDETAPLQILEVGCGPGALAEALHRWYPKAQITAIDRDSNFIAFGRQNVPGADFREADATRLPFPENSFDVTISNTVQEHIAPAAFWGEQRRVLKPGGVCLCLSARKGLRCDPPCLETTAEEQALWDSAPGLDAAWERFGVGKYWMSEAALPVSMEKYGFSDVETHYAAIDLTPDAPKYTPQLAQRMIEAMRQNDLEAIRAARAPKNLTEKALDAVNAKYDERLRLYRAGERQWDMSLSITMILRGIK